MLTSVTSNLSEVNDYRNIAISQQQIKIWLKINEVCKTNS